MTVFLGKYENIFDLRKHLEFKPFMEIPFFAHCADSKESASKCLVNDCDSTMKLQSEINGKNTSDVLLSCNTFHILQEIPIRIKSNQRNIHLVTSLPSIELIE